MRLANKFNPIYNYGLSDLINKPNDYTAVLDTNASYLPRGCVSRLRPRPIEISWILFIRSSYADICFM